MLLPPGNLPMRFLRRKSTEPPMLQHRSSRDFRRCLCASVPLCEIFLLPRAALFLVLIVILSNASPAADHPAPLAIPNSDAKAEAEMKPYTELIEHTDAKIE